MQKVLVFIKQEIVLVVALLLAVISMFLVAPDSRYLEYIDWKTLGILFCLMVVMAGLQEAGLFQKIGWMLVEKVKGVTQLFVILVCLCFFAAMLITNDVALITFVPFTFVVFGILGGDAEKKYLIPMVGLETIAANLGSMLTPIGNPQNLYLYGKAGMSVVDFLGLMLPYSAIAFVLLILFCIWCGKSGNGKQRIEVPSKGTISLKKKRFPIIRYLVLFVLSLLTVAGILPFEVLLVVVVLCTVLFDRALFKKVDYSLLLTFVGFFVFIGNMGRIPAFYEFLQGVVEGNEVITAVAASQVISNVPAALLLSGFTGDIRSLVIGTNLGGLGTLIASMASLISYKYIAGAKKCSRGAYIFFFTWTNLLFLVVLLGFWYIL